MKEQKALCRRIGTYLGRLVTNILYGTVKHGNDLNAQFTPKDIWRIFFTLKVWWISSTDNDRFIVLLAPQ